MSTDPVYSSDVAMTEAVKAVQTRKGTPEAVVSALVAAANEAGGKDNITVVYVEGEHFAGTKTTSQPVVTSPSRPLRGSSAWIGWVAAIALVAASVGAWWMWQNGWRLQGPASSTIAPPVAGAIVVRANESIAAALELAQPGYTVIVEPGEYRERLTLKNNVRITSRVSRGATLRLPDGATAADAAVVAAGVSGAELTGFRIVGDAVSPLGVGVLIRDSGVRLVDNEVIGATTSAVAIGAGDDVVLVGNDIHDNSGAALVLAPEASPRIVHNSFARNSTADPAVFPFVAEAGARPAFMRNVFHGTDARAWPALDEAGRLKLTADNWFIDLRPASRPPARTTAPAPRSR